MTSLKNTFSIIVLFFVCFFSSSAFSQSADNILIEIVKLDPSGESTLGNDDMLYVLIRYESDIPLRFQVLAMYGGAVFEVGAVRNPAALHAPGSGEALVWVGYTNPTHIDAVRVTVLNEEWREIYRAEKDAFSPRYFQYGSIILPTGQTSDDLIVFSGQAVKGIDQQTIIARPRALP